MALAGGAVQVRRLDAMMDDEERQVIGLLVGVPNVVEAAEHQCPSWATSGLSAPRRMSPDFAPWAEQSMRPRRSFLKARSRHRTKYTRT